MNKEQQGVSNGERQAESLNAHGRDRRRLSKAALAAAPILMTLHAAPLKAAGANCTPSGWVSGNTSQHPELHSCNGRTPEDWYAEGDTSASPPVWTGRQFGGVFDTEVLRDDGFTPATLLDAVGSDTLLDASGVELGSDDRQLVRFGAAAWLNAELEAGYALFGDQTMIIDMVDTALAGNPYTIDGSGDQLSPSQVKRFLEDTMGFADWGP